MRHIPTFDKAGALKQVRCDAGDGVKDTRKTKSRVMGQERKRARRCKKNEGEKRLER